MGYSFKTDSLKKKQHFKEKKIFFESRAEDQDTGDLEQLGIAAIFMATPTKNANLAIHFTEDGFFSIGWQYYLLIREIQAKFLFFPYIKWKWVNNIDLSSKVSLTCGTNMNYYKSFHHPISTLPVGIGKTLKIFKTNQ